MSGSRRTFSRGAFFAIFATAHSGRTVYLTGTGEGLGVIYMYIYCAFDVGVCAMQRVGRGKDERK